MPRNPAILRNPVMPSGAKHLDAHRARPFAPLRVTRELNPVMLSAAKYLDAPPDRPFAALRACPERSEWGDKRRPDLAPTCKRCSSAQPPSQLITFLYTLSSITR